MTTESKEGKNSSTLPNIIVTGVPGVGKSTLCEELVEIINKDLEEKFKINEKEEPLKMVHLNLSNIIKNERLYEEYDDELDASIFSEELVNQKLKNLNFQNGGYIIDFHDVNFLYDNKYIDKIFLLTASTNVLYERLEKRNYTQDKIKNNIECEIFQVIKEDILENYEDENIFVELQNNNLEDHDKNISFIQKWIHSYMTN
ncbi:adenylate kinase-like protein 1, putative [Plasmodium vinckei vinckei]|uniref:Adenylate kinase isoenzyme 6 homolog n=1 Tax=Plasmodium vinckei vinckei TaxID=54757 RepID=A0A449BME5_PLAVN|nr:adenylate kinase-like protein 1, putative [Plasmodium vinckei vinckei]VEV54588.1 adenylate kinase-like protein 1, putative [Plasmodium vinckei vinckei]